MAPNLLRTLRNHNGCAVATGCYLHLHRESTIWHGCCYKGLGFRIEFQPAWQRLSARGCHDDWCVVASRRIDRLRREREAEATARRRHFLRYRNRDDAGLL